uniref:WAT1-related protein At3g02690ic isoform X2 n=1 Tax=Rhizophora mucronata TaxID=61149 RepID=A0A2P2LQE6_RHIMU
MGMGMTLYSASSTVDATCPRLFNVTLSSLLRHRRPHHCHVHPYAGSSSSSFSSPLSSSFSSSSACSSGGSSSTWRIRRRGRKGSRQSMCANCSTTSKDQEFMDKEQSSSSIDVDCLGTGSDAECVAVSSSDSGPKAEALVLVKNDDDDEDDDDNDDGKNTIIGMLIEKGVLVSPFFFWGTAMVAMKEVLPILGPFFVASFRLIPAGLILVAFAASTGRPFPSGPSAWLSISLFGLVDAACFQVPPPQLQSQSMPHFLYYIHIHICIDTHTHPLSMRSSLCFLIG